MKITNVTKTILYQVETDDDVYPDYRTDENGEEWENYLGGIWQPIFGEQRKRLQQMFLDFLKFRDNQSKH